jgi:hypothetical protein
MPLFYSDYRKTKKDLIEFSNNGDTNRFWALINTIGRGDFSYEDVRKLSPQEINQRSNEDFSETLKTLEYYKGRALRLHGTSTALRGIELLLKYGENLLSESIKANRAIGRPMRLVKEWACEEWGESQSARAGKRKERQKAIANRRYTSMMGGYVLAQRNLEKLGR